MFSPSNTKLKERVLVSRLLTGTKFKFKVYAVTKLNQVADQSNWKYTVVYGKTGEFTH